MSWNVPFPKLCTTCDGSHEHVPCAGRDTRATQTYTETIVKIILESIRQRSKQINSDANGSIGQRVRSDPTSA